MIRKLVGLVLALVVAFVSLSFVSPTSEAAYIRPGSYATTTANLNLRSGPSTYYYVKRVIPYGGRVYVLSGPYNRYWYKVRWSGTVGYVHGYYLRSGSTVRTTSYYYSSKGQAIANTAKRYVGYRYAYYGNTPSEGFSCVGFTQWVYRLNGIWIPESLWGQYSMGWGVSRSSLRPGDLVFFQNTFWRGLSHAGIYVGNGWMIDSGTPQTGVHWSYIYDSYWRYRWFGARRLVN